MLMGRKNHSDCQAYLSYCIDWVHKCLNWLLLIRQPSAVTMMTWIFYISAVINSHDLMQQIEKNVLPSMCSSHWFYFYIQWEKPYRTWSINSNYSANTAWKPGGVQSICSPVCFTPPTRFLHLKSYFILGKQTQLVTNLLTPAITFLSSSHTQIHLRNETILDNSNTNVTSPIDNSSDTGCNLYRQVQIQPQCYWHFTLF